MRRVAWVLAAALLAAFAPPDERLADPALEARAEVLTDGLRCLVCEGQGVNDSNAPFARDVRLFVRAEIAAGASDAEVREALKSRFGDQIFQRPPLNAATLVLWFGPALAGLAALAAFFAVRGAAKAAAPASAPAALTDEERARIAALLNETP